MVSEIWDLNPISSSESADFFFTKLEDIQMFVSQPGPHELYDELSRVRVTFFSFPQVGGEKIDLCFYFHKMDKLS